jgi:hypothetical protein
MSRCSMAISRCQYASPARPRATTSPTAKLLVRTLRLLVAPLSALLDERLCLLCGRRCSWWPRRDATSSRFSSTDRNASPLATATGYSGLGGIKSGLVALRNFDAAFDRFGSNPALPRCWFNVRFARKRHGCARMSTRLSSAPGYPWTQASPASLPSTAPQPAHARTCWHRSPDVL